MIEIIEGIVLKNSDYQEKSKILQVFSKEHGLIGIFLKGANNYKSNSYSLAQPLTHASFNINYKTGLSSCFSGEVLSSFQSLKLDVSMNLYSFHLFELLLRGLETHQPNTYLFDLLLIILKKCDQSLDIDLIRLYTIFFELKYLYYVGIAPHLENCVECGASQNIINFDIALGGLVCNKCNKTSKLINIDAIKAMYELFYSLQIPEINKYSTSTLTELRSILNQYHLYHQGFSTNSSKYLT